LKSHLKQKSRASMPKIVRVGKILKLIKMKKLLLLSLLMVGLIFSADAQEYMIVTVIESIVPMGIGRSRIVHHQQPMEVKEFTTARTGGKDSKSGDVKRSEAKIDKLDETKLLNFYSGVGINMQNIASNDALITSKLNDMAKEGWTLFSVAAGVESKGSKDDKQGIFITRFIFVKK